MDQLFPHEKLVLCPIRKRKRRYVRQVGRLADVFLDSVREYSNQELDWDMGLRKKSLQMDAHIHSLDST